MSQPYRFCHNCGASLSPGQDYCFRCGAKYIEPVGQQPVVLPPPQPQAPYPPQGQDYAPSSSYPANNAQQTLMTPGSGQEEDSFQLPPSGRGEGISPGVLIVLVVVVLLLLVGIGSLFYNIGQHNGSQPGITPTPAPTHGTTPVPTHTPTPVPTHTPGVTPTPTTFQAPAMSVAVHDGAFGGAQRALVRPGLWSPSHGA